MLSEAIPGESRLLPKRERERRKEKRAGEEQRRTEAAGDANGNHPGAVGDDTEPPRSG